VFVVLSRLESRPFHEIWTKGPWEEGKILHLAQDTIGLHVHCSSRLAENSTTNTLLFLLCLAGTFANCQNLCRVG
jgi:hypothetical protein